MPSPIFHDRCAEHSADRLIRPFQDRDAQECSQLICECIRQDPSIPDGIRDELLRNESAAAMLERARLFYVAVCGKRGRIAGLGGVEMNEIRLLQVAPAMRGRGIGSSLLEHLETMVPAALFRDIFVYASPAAQGFYGSRGYTQKGRHPFRAAGRTLLSVFMVKNL